MNSQELELLGKIVILGGFTLFLHEINRFYRKTYKRNKENKKNV